MTLFDEPAAAGRALALAWIGVPLAVVVVALLGVIAWFLVT